MAEMKLHRPGLLTKMLIGVAVGCLLGMTGPLFGIQENPVFEMVIRTLVTFSSLFAQFLRFIVPLLIVSFIGVGLAELGRRANKLFGVTLLLSYVFTVIAGLIAVAVGLTFLPGLIQPITGEAGAQIEYAPLLDLKFDPVMPVLTSLILAFVIGLGMANLRGGKLLAIMSDVRDIIALVINKIIIPVIPWFMVALFANIAASGELVSTVGIFLTLFLFIIVFQWIILLVEYGVASAYTKQNQLKKIKNALPAYVTALGTKSSAATIPINMECASKNGTSKEVAGFVIPLCANIHLVGDAVCLTFEAVGIMLAFGMNPGLGEMIPFVLMLGLMMVAAPGVPGGGVMAALGLFTGPLGFSEAMAQIAISLHLTQDSFGTACNVTGDHAISFMVEEYDKKHSTPEDLAEQAALEAAEGPRVEIEAQEL